MATTTGEERAMRDISINLHGHRLTVVESPAPKVREDGSAVTDREGVTQFVVSLFAKQRPVAGRRTPKGEEIRVTLSSDPGPGFEEGEWVELIDPRVNAWEIRDESTGRMSSGLAFKAMGMKMLEPAGVSRALEPDEK
jgi:hypothetical protein